MANATREIHANIVTHLNVLAIVDMEGMVAIVAFQTANFCIQYYVEVLLKMVSVLIMIVP